MKRFALLFALLLICLTLPAMAEITPESAVAILHPEAEIIDHVMAGEDAFFLLQSPEGVRSLCLMRLKDGEWTEALHSEKVICPREFGTRYEWYRNSEVSLAWDGATLSLCYEYVTGAAWQYDFARDEAGEWRFVRLTTNASTYPSMVDVLTYDGGYVYQTFTRRWDDGAEEVTHFSPCPMPWLAGCETLAGFDAAAFPLDVAALNDDDMARVAAELLPEYTFVDGNFSDGASLLMRNAADECIFVVGEYRDGAWLWTASQPLPEGAACESYHASGDCFFLCFPHPDGLMLDWDEEEPVWVAYAIYRQPDGRWLLETIHNDNEEDIHINDEGVPGYTINCTGTVYGTVTLEQDVRYIDWSAYPLCLEDALAYLMDDMGVIGVDALPLYADAASTEVIAGYRYATPVTVLSREGSMVQVRIADSDIIGWLEADGLLLGAAQLFEEDEEGGWPTTAGYSAGYVDVSRGAAMYAAPEDSAACTTEWDGWYILMSDTVDGWYHICDPETLESGWIRVEDGVPVE
ncbi:MAG: hypothetical protein IJE07_13815 [Clostridia bacterium]|nr:hypothetical protein [Clostridia bacterium]